MSRRIVVCSILFMLAAGVACDAQNGEWRSVFPAKPCGADSSIYAVQAFDAQRLFVAGEDGAAHRSGDGGATWNDMDIAAGTDLYDIRFATPLAGIACGDHGRVAHSSDGGATWTTSAIAGFEQRALYAIAWLGAGTWIIAGGSSTVAHGQLAMPDGFLLRSSDGGVSWNTVLAEAAEFFWSVTEGAGTPGRVYAATYGPLRGGRILASDDAGITWREEASQLPFLPHDIRCAASGADTLCVACGGNPMNPQAAGSLALRGAGGVWSTAPGPDSGGFAWSAAVVADGDRVPVAMIGTQAGQVWTRSAGGVWTRGPDIPSGCPVYALAQAEAGAGLSPALLAGCSGHGLFIRDATPLSVYGPPQALPADAMQLRCYPQPLTPASGMRLAITWEVRHGDHVRLRVHDLLGRLLMTETHAAAEIVTMQLHLDCSPLKPGLYVCIVEDGSRSSAGRFVVAR